MAKAKSVPVPEPDRPTRGHMRLWLWIVAVVMLAGLVGASLRYFDARGEVTDLEQQLSDAKAAATEIGGEG